MSKTESQTKTNLIYGLLAIPLAIIGTPIYIYLPTYYSTTVGLSIGAVGAVLFLSRLGDVISDPIVGYLNDKALKHFNSNKLLLIFGLFILALSFYGLIHPPESYTLLWLFLGTTFLYFGWSLITIPYLSWVPQLTNDSYQLTKLNAYREFLSIIGILLALLFPVIFAVDALPFETLELLFTLFMVLIVPLTLLALWQVKPKYPKVAKPYSFTEVVNVYKNFPYLRHLQFAYFINTLANALPATLFLLFVSLVLGEAEQTGLLLLVYFVAGILALPMWTKVSKRIGKKQTWIYSMALASLAFVFVPFLEKGDFIYFLIITIISGFSVAADMTFPTSIQNDTVHELGETSEHMTGMLFSIWTTVTKLAFAVAIGLGFALLEMVNFDTNNPSENGLLILALLYGFFPVVFKVLAIFVMQKKGN